MEVSESIGLTTAGRKKETTVTARRRNAEGGRQGEECEKVRDKGEPSP